MKLAVVLHDVRSLHNVGSIFRTADAVGAQKIFLCGITPAPVDRLKQLRPDFAKVALGAGKYVPWQREENTGAVLKKLKHEGYRIIAVEQDERSESYQKISVRSTDRIALVMGAEVSGLPTPLLEEADHVVEIPMRGKKESLNVAVAFGVVAFGLVVGCT